MLPLSLTSSNISSGIKANLSELIALQAYANSKTLPQQKKVRAAMVGDKQSKRFGHGMDFAEFRHYYAGDDVRAIDWKVTARTNKTHIRVYQEERERPVFLIVDQSISLQFGTRKQFKAVLAAKVAALLAWSALQNNDRVGGIVAGIENSQTFSPRSGKRGVLLLLSALAENYTAATINWEITLRDVRSRIKPGSTLCLISDFYDFPPGAQQHLQQLAQHNDILAIHISDPLEQFAPSPDRYLVTDGKQELLLDTSNKSLVHAYHKQFQERFDQLKIFCEQHKISLRAMMTSDEWTKQLIY